MSSVRSGLRVLKCAVAALCVAFSAGKVDAADAAGEAPYPNRPIVIVDGFAPGGATDILARILGQHLGEKLGQPVVIENKAGAGGVTAASYASRARPDGYTVFLGTIGPIVVNPHLLRNLNYDPLEDLVPVIELVDIANVLVIRSEYEHKSVAELIAHAKANPGKLNYGSSGIGTSVHLAGEVFSQDAGVKLTHVPYRGGAPAMNGLLGGEVDLIFSTVPTAIGYIKEGRLKALAVTGDRELEALPGIPPMREAGVPNYRLPSWYGIFVPKGTAAEIVQKLSDAFAAALRDPEVRKRLVSLGLVPSGAGPEKFREQVRKDWSYWKEVLEKAGIKAN